MKDKPKVKEVRMNGSTLQDVYMSVFRIYLEGRLPRNRLMISYPCALSGILTANMKPIKTQSSKSTGANVLVTSLLTAYVNFNVMYNA